MITDHLFGLWEAGAFLWYYIRDEGCEISLNMRRALEILTDPI